jgi:glutathione S-transferase
VMALPAWREWRTAALAEPWVLAEDEVDWPKVPRV